MTFDDLLRVGAAEARLDYSWDDWGFRVEHRAYETESLARLAPMADAPLLALCISVAEWICAALEDADPQGVVRNYVWASWAAFSHDYAPVYFETRDDEWRGPGRALLAMTLINLNDAIWCRHEDPLVVSRADWICFLASKPLGNSGAYASWLEASIGRLAVVDTSVDMRRVDPDSTYFCPAFSREFFALERGVVSADTGMGLQGFLAQQFDRNPFLRSR